MKKIAACLVILLFFGASQAQQTILQDQLVEPSNNIAQNSDQEIEFTVEIQNAPMGPIESLCRDLIVGFQYQENASFGVTAASITFPFVVIGTREALGIPTSEQYEKELLITSGSVASASTAYHIIHKSRESVLKNLSDVVQQSQMCIQHQLCSDEKFEKYAEHIISENVDIEKFAVTIQNNTHSLCKTEKKADGRYSVRIKSAHEIKKILQDRYGLTS